MTAEPGPRSPSSVLADLMREFELTREAVVRLTMADDGGADPDGDDSARVDTGKGDVGGSANHDDDPADRLGQLLIGLRKALLAHPTAARAVVAFLTAEGRHYAATERGAETYAAMTVSPEVETLRTVWEKVTLNLLDDEADDGPVPDAWVELIRDLAVGSGLDRVAAQLRPDGLA